MPRRPTLRRASLSEATREILFTLTPHKATVLRMRFEIDANIDQAFVRAVGEQFEVNGELIPQIVAKVLWRPRRATRAEMLRTWTAPTPINAPPVSPPASPLRRTHDLSG